MIDMSTPYGKILTGHYGQVIRHFIAPASDFNRKLTLLLTKLTATLIDASFPGD